MPDLVGLTITAVRAMTPHEQEQEDWQGDAVVLELSDGTILYASQDEEGNGPGALVHRCHNKSYTITIITQRRKKHV